MHENGIKKAWKNRNDYDQNSQSAINKINELNKNPAK